MTVKELKRLLGRYDDDKVIHVWDDYGKAVEAQQIWVVEDGLVIEDGMVKREN